jgi:hypothetical protein
MEGPAYGQSKIGPEDAGENCSESGSSGAAVVSVIDFTIRGSRCLPYVVAALRSTTQRSELPFKLCAAADLGPALVLSIDVPGVGRSPLSWER